MGASGHAGIPRNSCSTLFARSRFLVCVRVARAMLRSTTPMSDLRTAIRALQKSPAFTLVAVVTIAIGIGANTTLFSVYDRLVLNPVTIPDPSSLVAIWTNNPSLNFNAPALSWSRYEDIRDHARRSPRSGSRRSTISR